MSKATTVPARGAQEEGDGFHYFRSQKLPDSLLAGSNPVYAARNQLKRFAPDADYVKDTEKSDEVFEVFKCPIEAYQKMDKGLQAEANSRTLRTDLKLKTAAGTEMLDKITTSRQTLDQLGAELPSTNDTD